jgi:hypothetical protein
MIVEGMRWKLIATKEGGGAGSSNSKQTSKAEAEDGWRKKRRENTTSVAKRCEALFFISAPLLYFGQFPLGCRQFFSACVVEERTTNKFSAVRGVCSFSLALVVILILFLPRPHSLLLPSFAFSRLWFVVFLAVSCAWLLLLSIVSGIHSVTTPLLHTSIPPPAAAVARLHALLAPVPRNRVGSVSASLPRQIFTTSLSFLDCIPQSTVLHHRPCVSSTLPVSHYTDNQTS